SITPLNTQKSSDSEQLQDQQKTLHHQSSSYTLQIEKQQQLLLDQQGQRTVYLSGEMVDESTQTFSLIDKLLAATDITQTKILEMEKALCLINDSVGGTEGANDDQQKQQMPMQLSIFGQQLSFSEQKLNQYQNGMSTVIGVDPMRAVPVTMRQVIALAPAELRNVDVFKMQQIILNCYSRITQLEKQLNDTNIGSALTLKLNQLTQLGSDDEDQDEEDVGFGNKSGETEKLKLQKRNKKSKKSINKEGINEQDDDEDDEEQQNVGDVLKLARILRKQQMEQQQQV
ncbi:MAG: hypothetical protein EZS28_045347, partial [Streblomastix strix]